MYYVKATNMKEAITKSWEALKNKGIKRKRNNQSKTDECLEIGLCLDLENDEFFYDYYAPKCVMLEGIEGLIKYDLEVTEGINDDKFNHTYHKLFAPYFDKCIDVLVADPTSRRAVLPIAGEASYKDGYPPCMQVIMVDLSELNEVNLAVVFRSNDAVKAFPSNLFAVKRLQDLIAKTLTEKSGVEHYLGNIVYVANNFHAYSNDYGMLDGYLKRMQTAENGKLFWTSDEYVMALEEYLEKETNA